MYIKMDESIFTFKKRLRERAPVKGSCLLGPPLLMLMLIVLTRMYSGPSVLVVITAEIRKLFVSDNSFQIPLTCMASKISKLCASNLVAVLKKNA